MRINFVPNETKIEHEIRMAEERLEELRKQAEREAEKDALRAQYGRDDEWPIDTVLFFRFIFHNGSVVYTYTALKCQNDMWYLSGPRRPQPVTWVGLVDFWLSGEVVELWYVSEYKPAY